MFLLCKYFILGTTPPVQQNVNFSLTDSTLAQAMNSLNTTTTKPTNPLLLCFCHFHDRIGTSMRVGWERHNAFEAVCLLEIIFENRFSTSVCHVYWALPQDHSESLFSALSFLGVEVFLCDLLNFY